VGNLDISYFYSSLFSMPVHTQVWKTPKFKDLFNLATGEEAAYRMQLARGFATESRRRGDKKSLWLRVSVANGFPNPPFYQSVENVTTPAGGMI